MNEHLCTFKCCTAVNFVISFGQTVSPLHGPPGTVLHCLVGAQHVGHPLRQQRALIFMTNAIERSILVLGMGATSD